MDKRLRNQFNIISICMGSNVMMHDSDGKVAKQKYVAEMQRTEGEMVNIVCYPFYAA